MHATRKTGKPYVWVTWLAKAIASDAPCMYSPWFRAHYQYTKYEEQASNLGEWNRKHTALMIPRRQELEAAGYTCRVEEPFKLKGKTADIAGKMDLVAIKGDDVLIVEGKAGADRDSDVWQVLIYLYAARHLWRKTLRLEGEVHYPHGDVILTPDELTDERLALMFSTLATIAGEAAPAKRPSRDNCRFCNIGPNDCPQRVMSAETATVGDF